MSITVAPIATRPPPRRTSPVRAGVRALGELIITFGVIILLLVVYQLYWTNLEANRAQGAIMDDLRESWSVPVEGGTNNAPAEGGKDKAGTPIAGSAIGIMYIERLGADWEKPIVQGVGLDDLARGVGHFPDSAGPGEVGNFAVAAHRATHGEPFAYLNEIRVGDQVVVETRDRWYVYAVEAQAGPGKRPWKLVQPSNGSVVLPVPEQPGVQPTEKLITMVTCNPRWGSTTRLIVYGQLAKTYPKPGPRPPELDYTTSG